MKALLFNRSDCAKVLARLGAYVDGELQEARRQTLEAHLGSCQRCSDELARLRTLRDHLHRSLAVSLPGQDARQFWAKVERKILEAKAPRWWTLDGVRELFWAYPKLRWASGAVLGAAILVFTADLLLRPPIPPPTPLGQADARQKTVVESVEGGPNSSVVLFSTPDRQLKIIWVLERKRL